MNWKILTFFCLIGLVACAPKKGVGAAATSATKPATAESPESILDDVPSETPSAGPTVLSRVEKGYELLSHDARVVIDGTTGDVLFWGQDNAERNLLLKAGIVAVVDSLGKSACQGYVEQRDDQTWQYLGVDANHISWRKIYCLEGRALYATFIVENKQDKPVRGRVQLTGEFASLRILTRSADDLRGASGWGAISLHAFNEKPFAGEAPALPVLLSSDEFNLKPGERASFTTTWILEPVENSKP